MLPSNLLSKWQEQFTLERTNEQFYRALASAADVVNRPGAHKYFSAAADDERDHARRVSDYIIDRGGRPYYGALVEIPEINGQDYELMFRLALQRETLTTAALSALWILADDQTPDPQTIAILTNPDGSFPGFLAEQTQTERELTDYLISIARLGPDGIEVFDRSLLD